MRILYITLNIIQQGSYWRAYHFSRQLAARGNQVTLVATSPQNKLHFSVSQESGFELVQSPDLLSGMLRSGYDPWNTLRRMAWLRNRKYDIVHAIEARPTVLYPARLAARLSGAPLIFDWADWFGHGGSVEERRNPILRNFLRPLETYFEEHYRPLAAGNTVINSILYQRAVALGIDPSKILLLPNGSDTQRIRPLPQAEARVQSKLPLEAKIIGYMGTIFKRDAEFLAEAFDQLQALVPQTRLLVIGRCPIDLRKLVNHPDLIQQIGIVTDRELVTLLACCDLFWLPLTDTAANRGRTPLKYSDYLAAGRPIVATAVGEISQIFKQGEVGLLTPPDPESFARTTAELLHDPDRMLAMGIAARTMAESDYTWDHLASGLFNFYTQTLKPSANVGDRLTW